MDWWTQCRDCTTTRDDRGAAQAQTKHSPRCQRERRQEDAAFAERIFRVGQCRCPSPLWPGDKAQKMIERADWSWLASVARRRTG